VLAPSFSLTRYVPTLRQVQIHIVIANEPGGVDMGGVTGFGEGFALIVVLFILLIVVGSAYVGY
jgi:uncharacterized protein (TIGR01732 family)